MSRPSIGSRILFFLIAFIFLAALIFLSGIIADKMYSPYRTITPGGYVILFIVLLNLVVFLILRFQFFFRELLFRLRMITKNRRYLYIAALSVCQMIIAGICYLNYRSNPKLYVPGDEIEKRHRELTLERIESDSIYIEKFNDDFTADIITLDFFLRNKETFSKSSDGSLWVGDSLIIIVSHPFSPPGALQRTHLDFYSKDDLTYLKTATFPSGEFDIQIPNEIKDLEKKLAIVKDDLAETSTRSADFRWSFLQFINLYFRERLEAMSVFLIVMDWLRYVVWFVISLLITSPLLGKIKKID